MSVHEKFLATMEFDRTAPPPLWEMAYWIETTERWSKEGMTDFIGDDLAQLWIVKTEHFAGLIRRSVYSESLRMSTMKAILIL